MTSNRPSCVMTCSMFDVRDLISCSAHIVIREQTSDSQIAKRAGPAGGLFGCKRCSRQSVGASDGERSGAGQG